MFLCLYRKHLAIIALHNNTEYSAGNNAEFLARYLIATTTKFSFSYSDDLQHEILLQADYPDPDEARSDLDRNMPSTAPTPPIVDLATTATDNRNQDPASI